MYFVLGKERISNPCIIELNVDIVEDTDLILHTRKHTRK